MTSTANSAHLLTWSFTAPEGYTPVPVQQLDHLREYVQDQLNWTTGHFNLEHSKHTETVRQQVIDSLVQSQAQLNLVLLMGHGKKRIKPGQEHAVNHIFCHNTDLGDLSITTFSLDDFVRELLKCKRLKPTLLIVDACEVSVRTHLDAGSPLVALLAQPDGKAEMEGGKSLLTASVSDTLKSFIKSNQSRSVQDLIHHMQDYVKKESDQQQIPDQSIIGSGEFLQNHLPIAQRSLLSNISLHDHMVNMCLTDELSDDALKDLEEHLQGTSAERNSELAFIVHVKRYERRDQQRRNLNEDQLAQLHRDKANIEARIGQSNLTPLVEATACLLVVSTDHNKELSAFNKQSYLERALGTLKKVPDTQTELILTSRIYDSYGSLKRDQGTKSKARDYYTRSIELKEKLNDVIGLEISRQNLGWFHLASGDFKHAALVFQEGRASVKQQLNELEKHKTKFQLYSSLLTSWTIHTYGLLVTQLINIEACAFELGDDPIGSIAVEVNAKRKLLRNSNGWFTPFFFGELERLCLYADGNFRRVPHQAKTGPLGQVIETIKECNSYGIQHGLIYIDHLINWESQALETQEIYEHMTWLAVLSVLCRKPNYENAPHELRKALINRLRELDRYQSLPRPDDKPWVFDQAKQNIELDITDWSEWGPNLPQKRSSDPRYYAPSFLVTSNFIQVLSWSHVLLGLCEANKSISDAFEALLVEGVGDQEDKMTQLSLGTYGRFARQTFASLEFESNWGQALKTCWIGDELLKKTGYESFNKLVSIRNNWAHADNPTNHALQKEIDRHQIIIKTLSEAIDYPGADLPKLKEAEKPGRLSDEQFRPVCLVNSRNQQFDCGPLLLTPRSAVGQVYYLPYRIENSVLQGKSGKIEYRRYGHSDHFLDFKISLKYDPEFGYAK